MERIQWDEGWEFAENAPPTIYPYFKPEQRVTLPHDISISHAPERGLPEGEACGYLGGTMGTYMKFFRLSEAWRGKRVLLEADGAYCNAEVDLNGHLLSVEPNGYTPFRVDLTQYLSESENRLTIFVNNTIPRNSRWYTGSGIYRHVRLRVSAQVHLSPDPLFLRTERVEDGTAFLLAEVFAENHTLKACAVRAKISLYRDEGRGKPHGAKCEGYGECDIFLSPCSEGRGRVRIAVQDARLWDIHSPELYIAEVQLLEEGRLIDRDEELFGIRTISLDPVNGFKLNGKERKLKGGCIHHDNGLLGAVSLYDAEYRRLKKHKENGFNAIRGAHNPMSRELLEACDRLGLVFFAEAFDVWSMRKCVNDYHLHFADRRERDLTALIRRDRNHPCIICWSIGNEVGERNGAAGGAALCAELSEKVRSLDDTRFVTAAVPSMFNGLLDEDARRIAEELDRPEDFQNGITPYTQSVWADRTEAFCAPLDLVGYNYLEMRYEEDLRRYPSRIICGTESFPNRIADIWEKVESLPRVIGDFVWTSWDYIGEAWIGMYFLKDEPERETLYPARAANCACFDLIGDERPALAFHRIAWGSKETYLAVHHPSEFGREIVRSAWSWCGAEPCWAYPGFEGRSLSVEVYSRADTVELCINGVSLGRKNVGTERKNTAVFAAVYEAGEIAAISYDADGREVSRCKLKTPGEACGLRLSADRTELSADGESLSFVEVTVVDADGERVPVCDMELKACVTGEASLAAFGSACPSTEERYTDGSFKAYRGRALAVVRAGTGCGKAELTVSCEKFPPEKIALTLK